MLQQKQSRQHSKSWQSLWNLCVRPVFRFKMPCVILVWTICWTCVTCSVQAGSTDFTDWKHAFEPFPLLIASDLELVNVICKVWDITQVCVIRSEPTVRVFWTHFTLILLGFLRKTSGFCSIFVTICIACWLISSSWYNDLMGTRFSSSISANHYQHWCTCVIRLLHHEGKLVALSVNNCKVISWDIEGSVGPITLRW